MTDTYNGIKKHLNIKVDKHLNDGFAHLTHFWQNNKNGVSQYFKPLAKEYLQSEILSTIEEPEQLYIPLKFDVPYPPPTNPKFKFIDLFAGIGGIRMAYQNFPPRSQAPAWERPFKEKLCFVLSTPYLIIAPL